MTLPIGEAALAQSIAELDVWNGKKPSAARIAEYFAPAVRDEGGAEFLLGETSGNYCAVGACWAAARALGNTDLRSAGLPHAYRASGLELENDARSAGAWTGAPTRGDLAIFSRGDPGGWQRHVGRVIAFDAIDLLTLDANGPGAAWVVARRPRTTETLRGFARYPRSIAPVAPPGSDDLLLALLLALGVDVMTP